MKVYVNRKPAKGPWGGGNKTLSELCTALEKSENEITFDLEDDVNVIICFDPRPDENGIWYQTFLDHREKFGSKIIQRVGDVGTHGKPELTNLVYQSSHLSDFVIFPSLWARNYIKFSNQNYLIVNNRPLSVFHENKRDSSIGKPVKIVTHHWSTNIKKGFSIYDHLSRFCKNNSSDFEFTFVGRVPPGFSPEGIKIIDPRDVNFLSEFLPSQDVYVTASLEEAGANHVLEALAAGLPIVYHENGGSISEYCSEYGVSFRDNTSLISSILSVRDNYKIYKNRVLSYNQSIDRTIDAYMDIICKAGSI